MPIISVFIHENKSNITIENNIPIAYLPHLKVRKHIPFVDKNTQKILERLLPSINENAIGLKIEVENKDVCVKVEVVSYENTN